MILLSALHYWSECGFWGKSAIIINSKCNLLIVIATEAKFSMNCDFNNEHMAYVDDDTIFTIHSIHPKERNLELMSYKLTFTIVHIFHFYLWMWPLIRKLIMKLLYCLIINVHKKKLTFESY